MHTRSRRRTVADLANDLVRAAAQAIYGAAYGPATKRKATAAVQAVLRALVDKHFPSEDVDYHYATEGLAEDVCDALAELEINAAALGVPQAGKP